MSPEDIVAPLVERAIRDRAGGVAVVGLCGAQGSGKSTLAAALCARIDGVVTLSLDDLYLTRSDRIRLATDVHPLLRTRGVPGTHDVDLGLGVLDAIGRGEETALPRFSKALDDRLPAHDWPIAPAGTRAVLLEGWCVGARPQPDAALAAPVNALERNRDCTGSWRRFVNAALAGAYQALFARLDRLVLLAAPDWDTVPVWRREQEDALRRGGATGEGMMDDAGIDLFVSHYERLTRHILEDMPPRADLVLRLGRDRAVADRTTLLWRTDVTEATTRHGGVRH